MNTENPPTLIVEPIEVKTSDTPPVIDESVKQKYCFIDKRNTFGLRLHHVNNEIGTVNLCQACELNFEMDKVKAKYNGSTKEMLKQNAIEAGKKIKTGFGKLFEFGKELLK